jgi:SAM-dependent methyltransferase
VPIKDLLGVMIKYLIYSIYLSLIGKFFSFFYKNKFGFVIPSQRGNNRFYNHTKVCEIFHRNNKKMPKSCLIIGCGKGSDISGLIRLGLEEIVGFDLFDYKSDFEELQIRFPNTSISFIQGDVSNTLKSFISAGRHFDIIISDAVVEHLNMIISDFEDISAYLRSSNRTEMSVFYSCFGPIWDSFGGDHVSGSINPEDGLAHLWMDDKQYPKFIDSHSDTLGGDVERIWIDKRLFSFFRVDDYLSLINVHFTVLYSKAILDFRVFKARHPGVRRSLISGLMFIGLVRTR